MELASIEELLGDHLINASKALRLGIEGRFRFFVPVEHATIAWGEVIKSSEAGQSEELYDPQFCLDIRESLYFQVTPQSLGEIFRSREKPKKTNHIELIFPEPLKEKSGTWDAGVKYQSRINSQYLLWPGDLFDITGKSAAVHLKQQRERSIEDLFVSREDVASYEKGQPSEIRVTHDPPTLAHSLKGKIIPQQQKFRGLCIDELRKYARRWADDFPDIPMK